MRIGPLILVLLISVAMVVSVAPGNPSERPAKPGAHATAHDCCKNHKAPEPKENKNCKGGPCAMQCCRVVPLQADAAPQLVAVSSLVIDVVSPPLSVHSLTEPQAIFHPPRA